MWFLENKEVKVFKKQLDLKIRRHQYCELDMTITLSTLREKLITNY